MAEKKLTKRDYFNQLLAIEEVKGDEKLVGFINHELELLAKKNASGEKKPTATQIANQGVKEVILNVLAENGEKMTISEMLKASAELGELSNQRVSALVRQLIADGKVDRIEEKRKAYFKIV